MTSSALARHGQRAARGISLVGGAYGDKQEMGNTLSFAKYASTMRRRQVHCRSTEVVDAVWNLIEIDAANELLEHGVARDQMRLNINWTQATRMLYTYGIASALSFPLPGEACMVDLVTFQMATSNVHQAVELFVRENGLDVDMFDPNNRACSMSDQQRMVCSLVRAFGAVPKIDQGYRDAA